MAFSDQPSRYGGGFVAALVAYGASRALGVSLVVPAVFAAIAYFAVAQWRRSAGMALRWTSALLLGQCGWMTLGAVVVPGQLPMVLPDIVLGLGLGAWMLVSLKRAPVIGAVVLETIGIAVNGLMLAAVVEDGSSPQAGALVGHLVLRLGIVIAGMLALRTGLAEPGVEDGDLDEVFS